MSKKKTSRTISKNNPDNRDGATLIVYCPDTGEPMKIVKRVPGGMAYKSPNGKYYPIYKRSYKNFEHAWVKK